jgi:cytochrome c551/c552
VSATATNHYHPIDVALSSGNEQTNYNLYVGSGNLTNGLTTSYLSLTPFMSGTNSFTTLAPLADNTGAAAAQYGPGSSDQVSCLTCHRAHASGWTHGLRWNIEGEFITYVTSTGGPTWPGTDTTPNQQGYADGMLAAQVQAAMYGRTVVAAGAQTAANAATTFAPFQRSLCNKCHAQD